MAEDEGTSALFDANTGDFTVVIKKETPGEVFPNLDLLTTLKQPKPQKVLQNGAVQLIES